MKAVLRRTEPGRRAEDVLGSATSSSAASARGDGRGRAGRADGEGVRPARLAPRAPGRRVLARAAARPGLGDDVLGRDADGRRPRRAGPAQARPPGADPDRARRRATRPSAGEPPVAAVRGDRGRGRALGRARVRDRRASSRRDARSSATRSATCARQADLLASASGLALPVRAAREPAEPFLARQDERVVKAPLDGRRRTSPAGRAAACARTAARRDDHGRRDEATSTPRGTSAPAALVLLRPTASSTSAWRPTSRGCCSARSRRLAGRDRGLPARPGGRAAGRPRRRGEPQARRTARRPSTCPSRARASSPCSPSPSTTWPCSSRRRARRSGTFLLSVSHELKTPLTAIRGYAEGLAEGASRPTRPPRRSSARRPGSSASSATSSTSRG